jgi:hypothetical protein
MGDWSVDYPLCQLWRILFPPKFSQFLERAGSPLDHDGILAPQTRAVESPTPPPPGIEASPGCTVAPPRPRRTRAARPGATSPSKSVSSCPTLVPPPVERPGGRRPQHAAGPRCPRRQCHRGLASAARSWRAGRSTRSDTHVPSAATGASTACRRTPEPGSRASTYRLAFVQAPTRRAGEPLGHAHGVLAEGHLGPL